MADLNELLDLLPLDQIAGKLGVDKDQALAAVQTALPSLLAGMQSNASSDEGANALASAIAGHSPDLVEGGVDLDAVDEADGQKIVNHVLGPQQEVLVSQLNGATPEGFDLGGLVQKALPMLAPVVLSFLSKKSAGDPQQQEGGIGDLIGGLLGGGQQQGGGIDLGGMLGGLLGGGGSGAQGGGLDLGGMLGGLFGKK